MISSATTFHPRWTKRAVFEGSGRDPLGLSRVTDNFTDLLLPSIITTTNRARYYSFYAWALRESHESLGNDDALLLTAWGRSILKNVIKARSLVRRTTASTCM